jgi:hypothetical protein
MAALGIYSDVTNASRTSSTSCVGCVVEIGMVQKPSETFSSSLFFCYVNETSVKGNNCCTPPELSKSTKKITGNFERGKKEMDEASLQRWKSLKF